MTVIMHTMDGKPVDADYADEEDIFEELEAEIARDAGFKWDEDSECVPAEINVTSDRLISERPRPYVG